MKILEAVNVNELRQVVLLDRYDIEMLIVERARDVCKMPNAEYKIIYDDQTEGSPAYRVGIKARVELTSKLP